MEYNTILNELNFPFFQFQKKSISSMIDKEKNEFITIGNEIIRSNVFFNTDVSGRSVSMTGLLCIDKKQNTIFDWNKNDKMYEIKNIKCANTIYIESKKNMFKLGSNLILTNNCHFQHWEKILKQTSLSYVCVYSKATVNMIKSFDQYDVVIVSEKHFNYVAKHTSEHIWKRVIIDKPMVMKNLHLLQNVQYRVLWFLSRFPTELYLKYRLKTNQNFINKILHQPSASSYWHGVQQFQNFIQYINISSFQPVNIPKKRMVFHYCRINDVQSNIKFISKMLIGLPNSVLHHGNKLVNSIEEYKQKYDTGTRKDIDITTCSICQQEPKNPVIEPSCHSVFCTECLLTWMNTKMNCPLCRKNIKIHDLVYISKDFEQNEHYQGTFVKTQTEKILQIVREKKKTIIFSKRGVCNDLSHALSSNNLSFYKITDNTSRTQLNKYLTNFNDEKQSTLLFNDNYHKVRMNLECVTDVLFYGDTTTVINQHLLHFAIPFHKKKETNIHYFLNHEDE